MTGSKGDVVSSNKKKNINKFHKQKFHLLKFIEDEPLSNISEITPPPLMISFFISDYSPQNWVFEKNTVFFFTLYSFTFEVKLIACSGKLHKSSRSVVTNKVLYNFTLSAPAL